MSLAVDGVWKTGVWATTVWAAGVWFESGAPTPSVVGSVRRLPSVTGIISDDDEAVLLHIIT